MYELMLINATKYCVVEVDKRELFKYFLLVTYLKTPMTNIKSDNNNNLWLKKGYRRTAAK